MAKPRNPVAPVTKTRAPAKRPDIRRRYHERAQRPSDALPRKVITELVTVATSFPSERVTSHV